MSADVAIPQLGYSMTAATVSEWLVDDGADVERDQPICMLESDKVEFEVNAPAAGVLRHAASAGEEYPVGERIATIE